MSDDPTRPATSDQKPDQKPEPDDVAADRAQRAEDKEVTGPSTVLRTAYRGRK